MNAVGTPVRTLVMALAAMTVGLLGALVAAPHGHALPPGGASTDTEGTAGTVSPRTLGAGEVLSFSISGFPAGETVNVKIDDGEFCSQKGVHGACVVHQQRIASDGTVQGSFVLPADLPTGKHWLRFLASAEILDDEGRYVGVKPYTLRGDTDFTVVDGATGASPTKTDGGSAPPGSSSPGSAVPDVPDAPGGDVRAGAAAPLADESTSAALRVPVPPGSAAAVATGDRTGATGPAPATPVSQADREPAAPFPVVGTAVLAAALLVAALLVLRRRPTP